MHPVEPAREWLATMNERENRELTSRARWVARARVWRAASGGARRTPLLLLVHVA